MEDIPSPQARSSLLTQKSGVGVSLIAEEIKAINKFAEEKMKERKKKAATLGLLDNPRIDFCWVLDTLVLCEMKRKMLLQKRVQ